MSQTFIAAWAFYAKAFDCEPKLLSPTFAVLDFADNVKITLKQADVLTPASTIKGGGTELSMPLADKETLENIYNTWKEKGIQFEQTPEESVYASTSLLLIQTDTVSAYSLKRIRASRI